MNIALVRLKIRDVLPVEAIRKIVTKECGEPLIKLTHQTIYYIGEDEQAAYARSAVIEKLMLVNRNLSVQGLSLCLFEAYRHPDKQRKMWETEMERAKRFYPNKTTCELESIVSLRVADNNTIMSGHQTGGAVDVTICNKDGCILNMGTKYLEFNKQTNTKAKFHDSAITENRRILLSAMKTAGFVNFPTEWWHYSYGDAMWAAYSWKKEALYGPIYAW